MNGSKTNPVISFLDDLNKQRAMAETEANLAADPTIKLRRLQAAKDDGREKCLSYIFGQVCANAVPTPGEVPYKPAPVPDMDKVVGDFVSSRTGGQGATFYVKEAIKRNSACAKNLLEGVDKLLTEVYLDKETNPESITSEDLKFKMTPEITDKLGKMISSNNLDALADVIKDNVKADAVDEVIAAKKEKDARMALEEELRNDPSITTPEQIKEAVDARFDPKAMVFYQPRLFEGILIKHFNEAATKESSVVESGGLRITDGSIPYRGWNVLTRVNDMFYDELEHTLEEFSKRFRKCLIEEHRNVRSRYYCDIMPIDIDKICQRFCDLIEAGKIDPAQQIEVIDTDRYLADIGKLQGRLRDALTNGTEVVDLPIRISKMIPVSEVPAELQKNIAAIKLDKEYGPSVNKFVQYAEDIAMKYGRTGVSLDSTFKAVAIAALIEVDIASMYVINADGIITRIRRAIEEIETTQPMTEAFVNALYEYTMFNVAKALKLESFTIPEIREIANSYAQNK